MCKISLPIKPWTYYNYTILFQNPKIYCLYSVYGGLSAGNPLFWEQWPEPIFIRQCLHISQRLRYGAIYGVMCSALKWQQLTLKSEAEEFTQSHTFQSIVVYLYSTTRNSHQLLPVSSSHSWVTQIIYQWQAGLSNKCVYLFTTMNYISGSGMNEFQYDKTLKQLCLWTLIFTTNLTANSA